MSLTSYMLRKPLIKLYNKIGRDLNLIRKIPIISQERMKRSSQGICVVSTTTRCNFNCPHCLHTFKIDKGKTLIKDMPLSVFEILLRDGKKVNFATISFSGGEPILHPRFEELVRLVVKYDYWFNFSTNSWLYEKYWPIVNKYRKNVEVIFFSLDGPTANIHDAVRDKPGSFKRVIKAIKFFKKNNFLVIVSTVFNKQTYHLVEDMANLCLKLGVGWLKSGAVMSPIPSSYGLTDEERFELIQRILNLRNQEKFRKSLHVEMTAGTLQGAKFLNSSPVNKQNIHFCGVLRGDKLYVDHDGGMLPCCDIYQECKNKPLIQEVGFEKALEINLEVINELKKQRLHDLFHNSESVVRTCDFCNKHIERLFDLVNKKLLV